MPTGAGVVANIRLNGLALQVTAALIVALGGVQPTAFMITVPLIVEFNISTPPGPAAAVVAVLNANGVDPDVAPGKTLKVMEYKLKSAVGKFDAVPAAKSTVPLTLLNDGEIAIVGRVAADRLVIDAACSFVISNVK